MSKASAQIHAPVLPPLKTGGRPLTISVISPTYNHARFLRQNLDSILSQTYRHFELIIVNDGSTDETQAILAAYAAKDPRIRCHRFEKNRGMMAAFNHGRGLASGDLIYGSASDDYLTASVFFERVVAAMRDSPRAAGAFGQAELIDSATGRSLGLIGKMGESGGYVPPGDCMRAFLAHAGIIPGVTAIWRRDWVDRIGGYPSELGPQNDYFVNHALAGLAGVVYLPEKVAVHRVSPDSYNTALGFQEKIRNYCLVEKKMRALKLDEGIPPEAFVFWRKRLADGLMSAPLHRKLFQAFRQLVESVDRVDPQFWGYTFESSKAFFRSIPRECERLEQEMAVLKTWALDEFKRVVGR